MDRHNILREDGKYACWSDSAGGFITGFWDKGVYEDWLWEQGYQELTDVIPLNEFMASKKEEK